MASTDTEEVDFGLWQEAVRSALGPLSAYLTPENFGLSTISLGGASGHDDEFQNEIAKRLDLARAVRVAALIKEIGDSPPQSYRHSVHYCDDRIDGALLIPRLIRERAAGRDRRIPVLRASHFIETPEALLVSESIRMSRRVANLWEGRGGAEGALASELGMNLSFVASQQPWSSLSLRPRPALRTLASTVKSRAVAGWTPPGGPIDQLSDLMLDSAEAVSEAAGLISFLLSRDRRFEDRLYELICLGWLLGALRHWAPDGEIYPRNLRKNGPLFRGSSAGTQINLYYQASHVGQSARYRWRMSGKFLRAIPDFALEIKKPSGSQTVLLDAKNRSMSTNSEIVYKMLGYRENLGLDPYIAVGVAPAHGRRHLLDGVQHDARQAAVLRLPLRKGAAFMRRALPVWLASFDGMLLSSKVPDFEAFQN